MPDEIDIKTAIISKAGKIGFDKVGFARAEILEKEYDDYREWIDSSYHAAMSYLESNSDKRKDISRILPSAKTVIVTAFNYNTPFEHKDTPASGKISRYAWGSDYHDILLPKLKDLASFIRDEKPGAETWCYVDTGPVLERVWAVKAGIGWQGKNGLVMNREMGSWFFLGVIITSIEVEPDELMKNYCGKCTKCINACPTGAIVEPGVVDSNKCLSYWTIEAKKDVAIPEEISEKQSGWLFGCDICQDVCPWNKKVKLLQGDTLFFPRNNETELNLEKVVNMEQEEFSQRFRKSPVKRTKLGGIQRNAASLLK